MTIYQDLYTLINEYIFAGDALEIANADLVCTLVATAGSIFLIALPFMIVWRVAKMIIG